MKSFFLEKWKTLIFTVLAIVVFAFLVALGMDRLMRIPFPSVWTPVEWASFLGSYIGGIATLAAVIITILYNRYERKEIMEQEKAQRIYKRATVIYYDFKFAFSDIIIFFQLCSYETLSKMLNNEKNDDDVFEKYRLAFTQLHIDSQWIQNVAELCEETDYTTGDIQLIYKIYGALNTMQQWVTSAMPSSRNAAMAILALVQYKKETVAEVELRPEIAKILERISITAKVEK